MKQLEIYYNTTNLSGTELKMRIIKAGSQDDRILSFFRNGKAWTPCEVHARIFGNNTPITSVRRSINTLTNEGYLTKLEDKKVGIFGDKVHLWKIK